ncbi:MAG: hypothetical protein RR229_05140 [Oscillospiraceae bacterium]
MPFFITFKGNPVPKTGEKNGKIAFVYDSTNNILSIISFSKEFW